MRFLLTTILTIAAIFVSCSGPKKKELDFGQFKIVVPETWEKVQRWGVTSHAGQIAIDEIDTLNFYLDSHADDLTERGNYMIDEKNIYVLNKEKTIDTLIYEFAGTTDSINVKDLDKDFASTTEIDHRKAKLVQPKKTGDGRTGIYIDSLWSSGYEVIQFEINGRNLKPENEKLFLEAIKTIKFKKR